MPKKRYSPYRKYKRLILPALAFIIILTVIIFTVKSCFGGDGQNDTESDTDDLQAPLQSDSEAENNIGEIYIPIDRDPKPDSVPPPTSSLSEKELDAARLKVTQDLGAEYLDKFYFLCDSPIYGLRSYGMLKDGTNTDRVISGISSSLSVLFGADALVYNKSTDSVISVKALMKELKPEYLLISIGSDDIKNHADMSYARFKSSYSALLTAIRNASPKTSVICMPILPSSPGGELTVYDAEKYNKYILEAAAETGCYYIDIASAFASTSGYLRIDCDGGNSRLNTTGLKRLTELIRTYGIKTASDKTETEISE